MTRHRAGNAVNQCDRIYLVGLSGSGKTVIGRELAVALAYDLLDTDERALELSGCISIPQIFDKYGEPHFRSLEQTVAEETFANTGPFVVATGGGLPAIPMMMERLNANGLTVYLKAEPSTLWNRLKARPAELDCRPLLRDRGQEALVEQLARRETIYADAHVTFRTDALSVREVCEGLTGIVRENTSGP